MGYLIRFVNCVVDLDKVVMASAKGGVILDGVGFVKMDEESAAALVAAVPEYNEGKPAGEQPALPGEAQP